MTTGFEEDLKYAIGWNKINLQILGIWPSTKYIEHDPALTKYWFIFHAFFMIGFITIPQSTYLFKIWGDIELMTEILATADVSITMSCLKLLFARYHLKTLRPLLSSFIEDWKRPKSEIERSIMLDNAKKARIISICCTTLAHFMTTFYYIPRIILIFQVDRNTFDQQQIVICPGYFPFDLSKTPALCLACVGQMIAGYSASASYIGIDTFLSMLVLHACSQISNLRHALENLPSSMTEIANNFTLELKSIVERHEYLKWYTQTIENSFNLLMLVQILACIIQVCFQAFQLFRVMDHAGDKFPIDQVIFIFLYISVILVQVYLYCYVGDMLIVESSLMGTSAYGSLWCNVVPKDARNILFVMHRSSTPFRLTAGKFSILSMEMFSNIIKTSLGYLSVLLTVSEKNK